MCKHTQRGKKVFLFSCHYGSRFLLPKSCLCCRLQNTLLRQGWTVIKGRGVGLSDADNQILRDIIKQLGNFTYGATGYDADGCFTARYSLVGVRLSTFRTDVCRRSDLCIDGRGIFAKRCRAVGVAGCDQMELNTRKISGLR